jgi:hypothetical protein
LIDPPPTVIQTPIEGGGFVLEHISNLNLELQSMLLQAGINYGPPGAKQLVYFVDDLNMPKLDAYETAMPISLIRQHL